MGCLPAVLSLGLAPILMRRKMRTYPAALDTAGMQLRNGQTVRWASMKRFRSTEVIYGKTKLYEIYEIWHERGRVRFQSNHIEESATVLDYILNHLPPGTPRQ